MVRIRHIIEMRKALKADPLLPPISKNRERSFTDAYDRKMAPKDIIEVDLQIRELMTDCFKFDNIVCLVSENECDCDGPWKLVTTTEVIPKASEISIPGAFTFEFIFERDRQLRLEICDYNEDEVTVIGTATLSATEIVASTSHLTKNLM
ncbi:unnamed protein product [Gongylonema pulchrum]|uniref:DUF4457 domain-containing protein n=1 Tax=Gongylonema pulchrum TaxID=637853 RepID=A0A183D2Y4_9BILA|nr:unnamed protein product [Gongylonema pulchrum]